MVMWKTLSEQENSKVRHFPERISEVLATVWMSARLQIALTWRPAKPCM